MRIGSVGNSASAGLANKISLRLGHLAAQTDKVNAKLATKSNPGQLGKAQRLMDQLADGVIKNSKISSEDLINLSLEKGNTITWGQAISGKYTPTPPPPPVESVPTDPTAPTDPATPTDPTASTDPGQIIDMTA